MYQADKKSLESLYETNCISVKYDILKPNWN